MVQQLWPFSTKVLTTFRYSDLYPSINCIWVELQSLRVYPDAPLFQQLQAKVIPMPIASYSEPMNRILESKNSKRFWTRMHLYSSPGNFWLHSSIGYFQSILVTLKRLKPRMSIVCTIVWGRLTLAKTAESAIVYTLSGLSMSLRKQLVQVKVAIPPAEAPVKTTFSAWLILQVFRSHLKCDLVLSEPLKYSWASLQEIGSLLWPWCCEPSQYMITTLVQLANRLLAGSVDKQPPGPMISFSKTVLVPRSVLDLLQQSSRTCSVVMPEQKPPPTKNTMKCLVSPPSWRQTAGGEPSRHLAWGSVL